MSKGKKQELPAKTWTDLVPLNRKLMIASKQTMDKKWRLMRAQQIAVTIQQLQAKKQLIQKQAADMQTLEKTPQTSHTIKRPKRGTIQSWTWSQRSHKVNKAWSGKTKMHSCTWTSNRRHISLLAPVSNPTGTMHQLKTKIMECLVQLCNSTPSQDSPQSKASNRTLIFFKKNLISYSSTSDLRPCKNSLELKSSSALNKLSRSKQKEGDATQCLASSNPN